MDNIRIYVRGGSGGQGKPKYGGIGGRGGNVYVTCEAGAKLENIENLNQKRRFIAESGGHSV